MNLNQLILNFCQCLKVQKQRAQNTVTNYKRDIDQFFSIVNLTDLNAVNDTVIFLYLKNLNKNQLSHRSIFRKMSALDQFWRYLIQEHHVKSNPWTSIRRPKISQKIPTYLEESTVLELLNNYPNASFLDQRNKAILELLFSAGIRVTELIHLRLDQINLAEHECQVLGKGNKERIVLFGSRAKQAIELYIDNVRNGWHIPTCQSLFISKQGTPLTARTVQRIVKDSNRYHSSAVEITPHSCRHTCASLLLSNGAGIRNIQELLGHSSITTTERYSHIPSKKLNQRFLDVMRE